MPDTPRPVATGRDSEYTLTIDEAVELYAKAGHPRTLRSVQRYCANGHLDCMKIAATLGDKYLVAPQSVARHIAQIVELSEIDARTSGRDLSRPDATQEGQQDRTNFPPTSNDEGRHDETRTSPAAHQIQPQHAERPTATEHDNPSPAVATGRDPSAASSYHEREVERLRDDVEFLRQQVHTKDRQIEALLERDKETNYLVQGLQQLLKPLLKAPHGRTEPEVLGSDREGF